MQQLHRSTLWRRKQKPASRLGRKREGSAGDKFNLCLLAKIFAYLARTGGDGFAGSGLAGWQGERLFVSMAGVLNFEGQQDVALAERAIEQEFGGRDFVPASLLVVAACEAFLIDVRRRTRRLKGAEGAEAAELSGRHRIKRKDAGRWAQMAALAAAQLTRDHELPKDEAKKLVTSALENGEVWIYEFLHKDPDQGDTLRELSLNPPCPSKFFRISPRMVSYWRKYETLDIALAMRHLCKSHLPRLMRDRTAA
jgi:hypothetical protein